LFVAAISDNGAGFIEWYDDQGLLVEEQRLDADGSGYFISYSYRDKILLKAEAHIVEAIPQQTDIAEEQEEVTSPSVGVDELVPGIMIPDGEEIPLIESDMTESPIAGSLLDGKPVKDTVTAMPSAADMARNPEGPAAIPEFFVAITGRESGPVWTDFYRYTRSNGLRSIERIFHDKAVKTELIRFPRFIEGGQSDINFVDVPIPYVSLFLSDIMSASYSKIDYTFDNKRRIITETYRNEEDVVVGELKNTWLDDHLASVSWTAAGDERLVSYSYDESGDRVKEENFRNGVLERSVTRDGDREIETLYKNNNAILRAVWVDGRKISEERLGRSRNMSY
ncbi:MAG: hypothetical protein LBB22_01085, partial [Treponema sp.]|jgi:hypothetical protein|nr:hypothetical protein [Treponema sp.]